MNEIITTSQARLPDTIPDLAKFVLIGRDKLKAVRAEIHAIDKVGIARDVYRQKLEEAQEIAEVVTDAECRIGELLERTELDKGGRPSVHKTSRPQSISLRGIGISKDQSSQFQLMAKHPESVAKAKEKAKEQGTVLSRNAVLKQIANDVPAPSKKDRLKQAEAMVEATKPKDGKVASLHMHQAHKAAEQALLKEKARAVYDSIYLIIRESYKLTDDAIDLYREVYSKKDAQAYMLNARSMWNAGRKLMELGEWTQEVRKD